MQLFCSSTRLRHSMNVAVSFGSLSETGLAPASDGPEPEMPSMSPARLINASTASVDSFMTVSSSRRDADCFDDVAQVARSIPERLGRLCLAAVAGRAHLQFMRAGRQRDRHL